MTKIILPNNWTPRHYQREAWDALTRRNDPIKRALLVWHRRAGKDDVCLHFAACKTMQKQGNYWHMLPQYAQARKSVWEAVNPHSGMRRIDEALPNVIRDAARNNDMFMRLRGGSTWQLVGSDSYNSLVGSPPIGVTASEWALADPSAWAYMRPILQENGGTAIFITTPRGRNHVKRMYDSYKNNPDWFVQKLTWRDTGAMTQEQADKERAEYCAEYGDDDGNAMFEQEWECSFDAAIAGSYYGADLKKMRANNQITFVPYDPRYPVNTNWDIGVSDSTIIYYWQKIGSAIHIIDRSKDTGKPVAFYAKTLKDKDYVYGHHFLPHDAANRDKGAAISYADQLAEFGIFVEVMKKESIILGISAVHSMLPRVLVDDKKVADGIDAWEQYHREWDEKRKQHNNIPVHDWSSHDADVLRYIAMCEDSVIGIMIRPDTRQNNGASAGWMR
jgi:hypothetical protein